MNTTHLTPLTKMILICGFLFVAYMLYMLTSSLYRRYQIETLIAELEQENQEISGQNKQYSEDYQYYASEAYKEKVAKENFGLVKAGEEVIILPPDDRVVLSEEEIYRQEQEKHWNRLSNPKKWWIFFFERGR